MKLLGTNEGFQKSVNIHLDLGNFERIKGYIPTKSSVAILNRYAQNINGELSENASLLIGPYGKGKSHLLLVLLSLLGQNCKETEMLFDRIKQVNFDYSAIEKVKDKRYLPVILNPIPGEDLNQTFVNGLRDSLISAGLDKIAPDSYYSEAILAIKKWKEDFPEVYVQFDEKLKAIDKKLSAEKIVYLLSDDNKNIGVKKKSLSTFTDLYPSLTAGSKFSPVVNIGALKLYQQIIRALTDEDEKENSKYDYDGIFIVFDEFSKYIEGHPEETFASDMNVLQSMCELANASGTKLFLTLVVHKHIREYISAIPQSAKNKFRGVEGRLTDIDFVVSGQNNYELIADALVRKEPQFSKEYDELLKQEKYKGLLEESYEIPCFSIMFSQEEYFRIIGKGCFPMAPLFTYALLRISEKIAQNERTIFTFLADDSQGTLPWLLNRGLDELIGVDKIYDYFKSLFKEATDEQQVHREWINAEGALKRVETDEEKKIIKAIAIARIIKRPDEYPCRNKVLRLSLNMDSDVYENAINSILDKGIVKYRKNEGAYEFSSDIGVDIDKLLDVKTNLVNGKIKVSDVLAKISEFNYEIPKQFNLHNSMTRFFQYVFMEENEFFHLTRAQYLFEDSFSDGKIIMLIRQDEDIRDKVQSHLDEINDSRVMVLYSDHTFSAEALIRRYEVIQALKNDDKFIDDNEALLQELTLLENDVVYEINEMLKEAYDVQRGHLWILRGNKEPLKADKTVSLSKLISEICREYYCFSPKVNNELLNVQNIGTQYLRARNKVISNLLEQNDCSTYMEGTNPEAMVYRAAFVHTEGDLGCENVFREVEKFFSKCAGKRHCFKDLYSRLYGKDYGLRKGIIPLFIAKKLSDFDATAVIYMGKRELEIDFETLNKVNEFPESFELFLEKETAEKEKFLMDMEKIFCVNRNYTVSKQGRLNGLIHCMQNWYRSLSQYAMMTQVVDEEYRDSIKILRNTLKKAEVNPRELLFDKYVNEIGSGDYNILSKNVIECKRILDNKLLELNQSISACMRDIFESRENDSLKAVLKEWYSNQSEAAREYVLSTSASNFMNYIKELDTNDENMIISKIAKIVTDIYVEDWGDATLENFEKELSEIKLQLENIKDSDEETTGRNSIILTDENGREIKKFFNAETEDSTSQFLKNAIEETLEEFGDSLEKNQKVAVLVEMLGDLLK